MTTTIFVKLSVYCKLSPCRGDIVAGYRGSVANLIHALEMDC